MIKQNMVFIENRAGSLRNVTRLLKEADIDLYGFACFDFPEFAIFRAVCDDPEKAEEIISRACYMNRITPVLAVDIEKEAGSLDRVLEVLAESNVSLDYIYTAYHRESQIPVVILHSEELSVTESVLKNNGFRMLGDVEELGR
ncbi:MAG: amino acid-binding protein [Eubacteriales bacterium]|nr:amino acid-binding protein [Eubacteriales bacterium]